MKMYKFYIGLIGDNNEKEGYNNIINKKTGGIITGIITKLK